MVVRELVTSLGFKVDEKNLNKYSQGLGMAKASILAIGAAVVGVGAYFLKAAGEMEQSQIALETMLGSAETAKQLLSDLTKMASTTPFEKKELVEYTKKLTAFGFGVEEIIPTMTDLGNIAAGVGKDKLGTLVLALGKIKTKGKASLEELNMFIEAGAINMEEWAKSIGKTTPELYDQISKGKIGYADVRKEIERLNQTRFKGLMEKQSGSFFGMISNLMDTINEFAVTVGNGLLPIVKDFMNEFSPFLSESGFLVDLIVGSVEMIAMWFAYLYVTAEYLLKNWIEMVGGTDTLLSIWETIGPYIKKIVPIILAIITALALIPALGIVVPFMLLVALIAQIVKLTKLIFKNASIGARLFYNEVKRYFSDIYAKISSMASGIGDFFKGIASSIGEFFIGVANNIYAWWMSVVNFISDNVDQLVGKIKGKLGNAKDSVVDFFGFGDDEKSSARNVSGSAMNDSSSRSSSAVTNYNANPTINIAVPEGNTRQQNQAFKSQAEQAAKQVFQREMKKLTENNPRVDTYGIPSFVGM